MKEKPFVRKIFEFNGDTGFTNRSKRYQAVLRFFSTADGEPERYFKITNVQDVVLRDVPTLFDIDLKNKPSDNKKKEHNRFSKILGDLERWKLISSREAKSVTGGAPTKEYKITNVGRIFVLIIRYYDSQNREEVYNEFYDDWMRSLQKFSTSLGRFLVIYLEKCKGNGLFHIFVDKFIHSTIKEWNERVRNENDLFTQMALLRTNDGEQNRILLRLWLESLYQLDEPIMFLFLNHLRIHINRFIEKRVEDLDKYELKRYEKRNLDNCVIAEFQCSFCNFPQYMEFPVVLYLMNILVKGNDIDDPIALLRCDSCGENDLKLNPII